LSIRVAPSMAPKPTDVSDAGNGFQEHARFAAHRGSYLDVQHLGPPRCPRSSRVYPAPRLAALWSLSGRLPWPQDHRTLGSFMDYRAVEFCTCLGHLIQQPRCDEGDRAAGWERMNPEAAVPLALGPAGAHFEEDHVLAVGFISRYRAVATGPGPAAIGVQDAQPEGLFRVLPRARVGERVERAFAPDELPVTQPRVNGELKAVRVGVHTAHGNSHVIVADQGQPGGGKRGNYAVWPHPGLIPALVERGSTRSGVPSKKLTPSG
jgi:hypothetical protein